MSNTQKSRKDKQVSSDKKTKKDFRYWFMTILSAVLVIVGCLLLASPWISDYLLNGHVNDQAKIVSQLTADDFAANQNADASFDYSDVQSLSLEQLLTTNFDLSKVKAIGEIAIPSVGVNLTVAKGTDNTTMSVAAGTLRPDQVMGQGNFVLASHYSSYGEKKLLFTPITNMKEGDVIYLTDGRNVYTYVTNSLEVVPPTRVDVADDTPGQNIITLITCYMGDLSRRLIVRGQLTETTPVSQATADMVNAFSMTKHIMEKG